MTNPLRVSLRSGWVLLILLVACSVGAFAQGNGAKPAMVTGEALITVARGTTRAAVDAIAANNNATVVYAFGSIDSNNTVDAYHLRFKNTATVDATNAAIVKLKQSDAQIVYAGPNKLFVPHQVSGPTAIPNDPRFNEQWDKVFMRMPEAWTLEKGQSNVVIAVVDTGVDINHPEFQGRVLQGYNSVTQGTDPNDPLPTTNGAYGHGTHVSGIAMAQANNSTGVAGIVWQNVKLLPISAIDPATATFAQDSLLRALQFVLNHKLANPDKQYVLNMSLGGQATSDTPDPADPFNAMVLKLAKADIVICISAGNSFDTGNPPINPANLAQLDSHILCVASTNHLGAQSYYSSARPYTTISAPGGDFFAGKLILSTWPTNAGSYNFEQGTSMASPQIAGLSALLLSVPGVKPSDVKSIITTTARPAPNVPIPSPAFGYGYADAYQALLKVAISVTIITPDGTGGKATGGVSLPAPVETLTPLIRIKVTQITPDRLTVTVDGVNIPPFNSGTPQVPGYTIENVQQTGPDANGNVVPLIYDVVIRNLTLAPGQHTIGVIGVKPGNPDVTVTDTRIFSVTPHLIPAGRSMVAFPYYEFISNGIDNNNHLTPNNYLGTDFKLARWIPDQQRYEFYTSFGPQDAEASFTPPSTVVHKDGDNTNITPLGLGFFADLESAKPVLTHGQAVTDRPIIIPLKGNGSGSTSFVSWNMVGDPFPFDVPFNSCLVDTPSGRITIQDAVARNYILPNIYSYDGDNGYTFRTLPDGALKAWSAHWVGVTSRTDISLVVPPTPITRAAPIADNSQATGKDGWKLTLSAHVRKLGDTYNFIGVSTRAVDAYDKNDVLKPPMVGPYVSLGVNHADWGQHSGLYAQDIRSSGATQTWNVVVNTDQPNSDVTVSWSGMTVPRAVKLTIKDETNGQILDMRSRNGMTFNSGSDGTTRRFTVTSRAANTDVVRITNVAVRTPGRGSGVSMIGFTLTGDANYAAKVLNGTGSPVANIGSRAAGAGDVNLVWNGKDAGGKNVASGTYLVQIKATGTAGDTVTVIYPFSIVR